MTALAGIPQLCPSNSGEIHLSAINRTLIWNERQLRVLLVEYLEHYNGHRPHRGINQNSPTSIDQVPAEPGPIDRIRRQRILGGLVNGYHHAA